MTAPLADRIRAVLALASLHPPGPWSLHLHNGMPGAHINEQRTGRAILFMTDGTETPEHGVRTNDDARNDAAFIAAAPEMAALLRECLADDGWRPIAEAPRPAAPGAKL